MSRGKEMTLIAAGMLTGALLVPTAHAAVRQLTATPSAQKVYVDGAAVQMDAYNIGGSNYVKLRDIGEAVGFNVYWDGKSVQIDSDAPYTGNGPKMQTIDQIADDRGLTYNADGSINVPQDGSKYIPKAGDRVRCDDGYIYEVKDVLRYDNNVFADGPVGPYPPPPATGAPSRRWRFPERKSGTSPMTTGTPCSSATFMRRTGCSTPSTTPSAGSPAHGGTASP